MKMKKTDLLAMSLSNLFRRKFRTTLTITGVVIGAASIIMMLSLGIAMDKNMEEQMAMFGDLTQVQVYSYGGSQGGQVIDDRTIQEFQKLDHVTHVVPLINDLSIYLICDKYRTCWPQTVYAMSAEDMKALDYKVDTGRLFNDDENKSIVLGSEIFRYFTKKGKEIDWNKGEPEPMPFDMDRQKLTLDVAEYNDQTHKPQLEGEKGKVKRPKTIEVSVTGMFENSSYELSNIIIVPKGLYQQLKESSNAYKKALGWQNEEDGKDQKKAKTSYEQVIVKVDDKDHVTEVVDQLKSQGYDAWNNMEDLKKMEEQSKSRQMALGAIGIVSFIVAAIGIANTMMMSIYERTREIGVMKVIGARVSDIRHMFLMESLLIGFFGGVIGAAVSALLSVIMNASGEKIAEIMAMDGGAKVSIMTPQLLMGGIIFSMLVGLVSGYFPARQATKLSALAAIKTE